MRQKGLAFAAIPHEIPMKPSRLLLFSAILLAVCALPACRTTVTDTTSILPDGTRVTTQVTAKSSDPAAIAAAEQAAAIVVPLVEALAKP